MIHKCTSYDFKLLAPKWWFGTYPVTTIVTIRFPSHKFLPANFKFTKFVFTFEKRTKAWSLDNSRSGN